MINPLEIIKRINNNILGTGWTKVLESQRYKKSAALIEYSSSNKFLKENCRLIKGPYLENPRPNIKNLCLGGNKNGSIEWSKNEVCGMPWRISHIILIKGNERKNNFHQINSHFSH